MLRFFRSVTLASATVFCAVAAHAEEGATEPAFAIEYVAPENCPAVDSFRDGIVSRAPTAVRRAPFETVRVRLERRDDGVSGSLVLVRLDGTTVERSLRAARCEEVVDGLALMAVMAIEDEEQRAPPDQSAAPPSTPMETTSPPPAVPRAPREVGHRLSLRPSTGLQGAHVGGVASASLWALQSFFELGDRSEQGFRPSFRATLKFAHPVLISAPDEPRRVGGRIQWTAAALSACPVGLRLTSWAHFRPCVEGNVGFMKASGPERSAPRTATTRWISVAALARLTAEVPWTALRERQATSKGFFFELELGLVLPLLRYAVTLGSETLYVVPTAGVAAGIAVGCRL